MVHLDYQPKRHSDGRPAPAIAAIAFLILAWSASVAGEFRVSRLNWSGYDPDPSIAQSIANDERRAKAAPPFATTAFALDLLAILLVIWGLVTRRHLKWNLSALVLCLGCAAWHGLGFAAASFFALLK